MTKLHALFGSVGRLLGILASLTYIACAIINSVAIYSFFKDYLSFHMIFSGIFALLVSYLPLVGNICGFFAMHNIWEYSFHKAFLISFFNLWFLILLYLVISLVGYAKDYFKIKKRRNK